MTALRLLLVCFGFCLSAANGSDHWAYQPVVEQMPPTVLKRDWPRSELDRFILAKIESTHQTPAPDADKQMLLRRVYYDLIGLPPTPEQIEAFLKDHSPHSWENLVDQLLASRHFGERWGRHWLDVARFAESVTLRGLVFNEAWRYRDYVIDSFNRDQPFDRFITEQIAGDLLSCGSLEETHRARAATTYLVLGNFNYEEQDKDQLRMDIVDEQLDTIGKGLLGQTIGCARCHDHKFDPIPTRDYYAMAGILRSTRSAEHANVSTWLEVPLPLPPGEEEKVTVRERRIAELNRQVRKQLDLIAAASPAKREATMIASLPGIVVDDSQGKRVGDWKQSNVNKPYIGEGYVHDLNEGKGSKTITFLPELQAAGRYEVRFAYTHGDNRATRVPITILHAAGETTVNVNQKAPPPVDAHFVSLGHFEFERGNQGYVLVSTANTDGHVIADAVQFLPADHSVASKGVAPAVSSAEVIQLNKDLETLRAELKMIIEAGPKRPMAMSVKEEGTIEDTRIHLRGSVHNLGERVPRGFLQVATKGAVAALPTNESGRREFAAWIASTNNPLTARVYVNRVWGWLFGTGIVRTPDNFGTTGETPSHPELLDYLALRFMRDGWSTKKLVREIILSRTYQLSSMQTDPALLEIDPENRLFARATRRRLDAETLRDTMLAISGRIDLTGSGRTFKPGTAADFGYAKETMRRSVYVPAFRNALPPIFALFDFADTSVVSGQRHASVVAPQALYFLNDPFVAQNARRAAERGHGSISEPLLRAYRETLGRNPTSEEERLARQHLEQASDPLEGFAELYQALFASIDFRHVN